jgi:hypothetical protein
MKSQMSRTRPFKQFQLLKLMLTRSAAVLGPMISRLALDPFWFEGRGAFVISS